MHTVVFSLPTRIIFGAGAIDTVGAEAAAVGRHALVVTGTTFARRSGVIDRLRTSLGNAGVAMSLYDQVGPNPRVDALDAGGRRAREEGADLILGLGGGSAMDAAKAIALSAATEGSVWRFTRHRIDAQPEPITGALPIVQVPMVASTGSETNQVAVVFDEATRTKAFLDSPHLLARAAIVDPTLTFSVPPHFTAVGGMNVVSQLLEHYLTGDEFPASDRITEGLVRVVMDSLPRAMRRGEDLDARSSLSWVAAVAASFGMAGRSGSTPIRAMSQPLGAHFEVDHGRAVAALWPSYARFALGNRFRLPQIGRFKRYALLGRQLFGVHETDDEVAAEMTSYRLVNWLRSLEMPTNLIDAGLPTLEPAQIEMLADQAVTVSGNGRRLQGGLTIEDIEHIYEGALRYPH